MYAEYTQLLLTFLALKPCPSLSYSCPLLSFLIPPNPLYTTPSPTLYTLSKNSKPNNLYDEQGTLKHTSLPHYTLHFSIRRRIQGFQENTEILFQNINFQCTYLLDPCTVGYLISWRSRAMICGLINHLILVEPCTVV